MRISRNRTDGRGAGPRATLEALEGRRLLAGNVMVSYDGGSNTVNVVGDNRGNEILISDVATGGYTVTGLAGTTVNGMPAATIVRPMLQYANFDVRLRGGDDGVEFNNFSVLDLEVDTDSGHDDVDFFNATAFNGIDIETGSGWDIVDMDFVDIHEGLAIDTGSGLDILSFGSTATGVTLFSGNANLNGGSGLDFLIGRSNLHTTSASQNVRIRGFELVL